MGEGCRSTKTKSITAANHQTGKNNDSESTWTLIEARARSWGQERENPPDQIVIGWDWPEMMNTDYQTNVVKNLGLMRRPCP